MYALICPRRHSLPRARDAAFDRSASRTASLPRFAFPLRSSPSASHSPSRSGAPLEALHLVRSNRARSVVRGIAITLPYRRGFALLLSSADPIFADWRDAIDRSSRSWEFLPRTIFFFAMLAIVLGAFGFADRRSLTPSITSDLRPRAASRWLGDGAADSSSSVAALLLDVPRRSGHVSLRKPSASRRFRNDVRRVREARVRGADGRRFGTARSHPLVRAIRRTGRASRLAAQRSRSHSSSRFSSCSAPRFIACLFTKRRTDSRLRVSTRRRT